jgi:hypothetical protein
MKSYFVVGLCIVVIFVTAMLFSSKASTSTGNEAVAELFSTNCPAFESDTGIFLKVNKAPNPSMVHLAYLRMDGKTKCTVTIAEEKAVHSYEMGQPLDINRIFEGGDLRTVVVPVGTSFGGSLEQPPQARTY